MPPRSGTNVEKGQRPFSAFVVAPSLTPDSYNLTSQASPSGLGLTGISFVHSLFESPVFVRVAILFQKNRQPHGCQHLP
jgi:hypothetical protein